MVDGKYYNMKWEMVSITRRDGRWLVLQGGMGDG